MLPAHWGELLCSTTPAVTIPQWLDMGGSARASCQRLFRTVSSIDFQLHYLSCQVIENFRWIHSQLQKITDGCTEVTHRLSQVEILVFNLDALLEAIQEQIRWIPQKGVLPKSLPKAKTQRPRPSSVLPPKQVAICGIFMQQHREDIATQQTAQQKSAGIGGPIGEAEHPRGSFDEGRSQHREVPQRERTSQR